LKKSSTKARLLYRRNVDNAYNSVIKISKILNSTSSLEKLKEQIVIIDKKISNKSIKEAQTIIKKLVVQMRSIPGTSKITKELSNARRALRRKKSSEKKVQQFLRKAKIDFFEELEWRKKARINLKPGLDRYQEIIRETIGLRLQTRLPHNKALTVAICKSNPLDLTLSF
jgi:GTPase Era involved in 16S rRNA processing